MIILELSYTKITTKDIMLRNIYNIFICKQFKDILLSNIIIIIINYYY